ncbi:response regulator [Novosphingobium sp. ZN18A2]|uniref:response regulator n=1 Tax=Novosphingobium sp. ZN18A2 TaxID=3079861 RepID=UPI0030D53ADB
MPNRGWPNGNARPPRAVPLGRALIVEDNALLALEMEQALLDAGAESAATCPDVAGAMREIERHQPDILVLDVTLADRGDGWAIAVLAVETAINPPLIIFSTAQPDRIPRQIRDLGHVLEKPFAMEDLATIARKHARRGSGLRSLLRKA